MATTTPAAPATHPKPPNVYECLILLDSSKVAGDLAGAVARIQATLEKHHAEILASRPWDDRKLAYPIDGQKKGQYYLIYFQSPGSALLPIEHDFALNEAVLRYLVLKIEPKWVETMLALARDEHALALQSAADEAEAASANTRGEEGGPPEGREGREGRFDDGGPPRRGRRPVEVEDKV